MTNIAVTHPDLQAKGGAEAVCMNILEVLQEDYNTTLLTTTPPLFENLNKFYNTNVNPKSVTVHPIGTRLRYLDDVFGDTIYTLYMSAFARAVGSAADKYDLIMSTYNEVCLDVPSIQYIHMPYVRWAGGVDGIDVDGSSSPLYIPYNILCRWIAGFDRQSIRSKQLLANSRWTANVVESVYDIYPTVIYPPIDTAGFDPLPWAKRDMGFVSIGRISPEKRTIRTIKVIGRVRQRNHDVHLHIVGPSSDDRYAKRVKRVAEQRQFVHLEGEMSRSEMIDLICAHKYGIHGMEYEHFGMAVAELAVGGAIPFVPNSGGQREILHEREELLYDTVDEAATKIDTVLSNPELQDQLRERLRDTSNRFGRDRFKTEIRKAVRHQI